MQLKKKWIIIIRSTVFLSLVGAIIGVSVYGCKKEEPVTEDTAPTESVEPSREYTPPKEPIVQEPQKEDTLPKKSVSLEDKLYKQTTIAFDSSRDGNPEIYVMNADGSKQINLTNNPADDTDPSWSPFLSSEK